MTKEQDSQIIEIMSPIADSLSTTLGSHDNPPRRLYRPNIHPLKIICSPNCEGSIETGDDRDLVTPKRPGWVAITPDYGQRTGDQQSVYIMLHESIPAQYKPIVYFHEVMEASTAHHIGIDLPSGHDTAEVLTDKFAQERLSPDEYKRFRKWQRKLIY